MRASLSLLLVAILTASPALAKSRPHPVKPPRTPHHAPAKPIKPISKSHHGEGRYRGSGSNDNG